MTTQHETIASDEDTCALAELVRNGTPIEWGAWLSDKSITPVQAAKLCNLIDPVRWASDYDAKGQIDADRRYKIDMLTRRLEQISNNWSLADLVEEMGDQSPYAMRVAVEAQAAEINRSARGKEVTRGIEKRELLTIPWPLSNGHTMQSLSRLMSDLNNSSWLRDACVQKGARGKPALWSPVLFGHALINKRYANKQAIDRHIKTAFSEWLDEWEASSNYGN